jgi:hypothetical protein
VFRPVLAVALAVALLSVTLPAVDTARAERADAQVASEVRRLAEQLRSLQRRDDPALTRSNGPRWYVTLELPRRSWTSDGVDYVAIDAGRNETATGVRVGRSVANGTLVAWQTDGRDRRLAYLPSLAVRAGHDDDEPLILDGGGSHRLALSLVRTNATTSVTVWRPDE